MVQRELLSLPWPDPILSWQECAEVVSQETGELVWRGLRVRMGMAYGLPTSKAPLNTGKAEARGAALAAVWLAVWLGRGLGSQGRAPGSAAQELAACAVCMRCSVARCGAHGHRCCGAGQEKWDCPLI